MQALVSLVCDENQKKNKMVDACKFIELGRQSLKEKEITPSFEKWNLNLLKVLIVI